MWLNRSPKLELKKFHYVYGITAVAGTYTEFELLFGSPENSKE